MLTVCLHFDLYFFFFFFAGAVHYVVHRLPWSHILFIPRLSRGERQEPKEIWHLR